MSLGAAAGGAAFAGRQTIGRGAQRKLESQEGKDLLEEANKGDEAALKQYNQLKRDAGGSFDVRQTAIGKFGAEQAKKLGGLAGISATTGMNVGQGGRAQRVKDIEERKGARETDLSAEGKRKMAEKREARGDKKGAGRLRKAAYKQATTREEREKVAAKAAGEIRENLGNPNKVKEILGKKYEIKPNELRLIPTDILKDPSVSSNLRIADLNAIKGELSSKERDEIFDVVSRQYPPKTSTGDWIRNPENGYL